MSAAIMICAMVVARKKRRARGSRVDGEGDARAGGTIGGLFDRRL